MQSNNYIVAFVCAEGVDLVRVTGEDKIRTTVDVNSLRGMLGTAPVEVKLTDSDDSLELVLDGEIVTLQMQPKGHFFAPLNSVPERTRVSLAKFRQLRAPF